MQIFEETFFKARQNKNKQIINLSLTSWILAKVGTRLTKGRFKVSETCQKGSGYLKKRPLLLDYGGLTVPATHPACLVDGQETGNHGLPKAVLVVPQAIVLHCGV